MYITIKFLDKTYAQAPAPAAAGFTEADVYLSQLSLAELASLFNLVASNLDRGSVKKFADRKAAERRTWAILNDYAAELDESDETVLGSEGQPIDPETGADIEPEAPAPKKRERATRIKRFNFVPDHAPKPVKNANTLRGEARDLLLKGATFEQVEALVREWDVKVGKKTNEATVERRAYELVRIMHYYLGYGVRHDINTGIITLYEKK